MITKYEISYFQRNLYNWNFEKIKLNILEKFDFLLNIYINSLNSELKL